LSRIAVVGAGAIGGFLAAAFARAGVPVALVARGPHLDAMRSGGLRIRSDLGSFTAHVDAAGDLRELGDFDYLLLTFKAHQWPGFLEQLRPFAARATNVVTLQNGLPFWFARRPPLESVDPGGKIGALFPDDRTIGGVVHVSGTIVEPGFIRQSGGLRYVVGTPCGGRSDRVDRLAELFGRAELSGEVDPRIRSTVWLKLVNNAALNPTSVLHRMSIKRMLHDARARAQVRALMLETAAVGEAMGVVQNVDIEDRIEYAARLDDVKTSMLQDYERSRPLELEPIVGAVIELGARYGVPTPSLRAAHERLRSAAAEAGHR
jgi:2-dehydropantoate 2-reductase